MRKKIANVSVEVSPYLIFRFVRSNLENRIIAVFPQLSQAEMVWNDYNHLNQSLGVEYKSIMLPEIIAGSHLLPEYESKRCKAVYELAESSENILFASVSSLLAPSISPGSLKENTINLRKGDTVSLSQLIEKLVDLDYDDEYEVNVPAEFSRRGGILDIFSPAHDYPVRIEFFGDEIDSMRIFSPERQTALREVNNYTVIPRNDLSASDEEHDLYNIYGKWRHKLLIFFPEQCSLHLERFGTSVEVDKWHKILTANRGETYLFLDPVESSAATSGKAVAGSMTCDCFSATHHLHNKSLPDEVQYGGNQLYRQMISDQLRQWLDSDYKITVSISGRQAEDHIHEWCREYNINSESLLLSKYQFPTGIIIPDEKIVIVTEKELFSVTHRHGRETTVPRKADWRETVNYSSYENFSVLNEGDYAVHFVHGIGVFRGIKEMQKSGSTQEMIVMEYGDGVILYVPIWQINLISRYIGSGKNVPTLSKIGGKKWTKRKLDAIGAVKQLAREMLEVQAARIAHKGYAYPMDDVWQKAFDEAFIYKDTVDQVKAAAEIKADMSSGKPMDRLLCGDVGYGKTEVAMRAAFKAVMAGKQVAVLVPTTVLAQQHLFTFSERFTEHPVLIEMLSRFRSKSEQKVILEKIKQGTVDIIIGTHRLIQDDIEFNDLGLVIIDEEQRFGVAHKEKLKRFRADVDVLTMTATPIPRTLYLGLAGIRDLSTIITPPNLRLPVQTIVCREDDKIIKSAIESEVQRGGQVFYLHNRVKTIDAVCLKLENMIPGVIFGITHGQMDEDELERIMADFINGKIDVLVTTTIIESGLDIPNANTIIIERADRFGLAELYQLRGRVGRWTRQAYSYLLLPKHRILDGDARRRIAAIRQYTQLGAGFKLALRDLEIRGAGNLLGSEQSGHINSIGFELYCQFLSSTVSKLKGQGERLLPEVELDLDFIDFGYKAASGKIPAGFPPDYIPSEKLRIEAYRRLSMMVELNEVDRYIEELRDRFGILPDPVNNFLLLTKIRISSAKLNIRSLTVNNKSILLDSKTGFYKGQDKIPKLKSSHPKDKLSEVYSFIKKNTQSFAKAT